MPEDVSTSATITASGAFVHSGFGPASNEQQISSAASASAGTAGGGVTFPATGQQWPLGIIETVSTVISVGGDGLATSSIELYVAVTSDSGALSVQNGALTFFMPYSMTLESVRADLVTPPQGSVVAIAIKQDGSNLLSGNLTIDPNESSSVTAASSPTIANSDLLENGKITIDISAVGSTTPGSGLKVLLKGKRTAAPGYGIRESVVHLTSSVANAATTQGVIQLPKSCLIHSIGLSRASWFRLYESVTARSNDLARPRNVDPGPDDGVCAEVILAAPGVTVASDKPVAANAESPTTNAYPYSLTNDDTAGTVSITITYLALEA